MNLIALVARKNTWLIAQSHERVNRMPVQIAEVRQTGYIRRECRKSSENFTPVMAEESVRTSRTPRTLENMGGCLHKIQTDGVILRRWHERDNGARSYSRKVTIEP